MKKYLIAIIAIFILSFSVLVFSACNSCGDNTPGAASIVQSLKDCSIKTDGMVSMGLVQRNSSLTGVKSNALISVDQQNKINDVIYYKNAGSGAESEVDISSWYVRNFKVTKSFIFIYYVNYDCEMMTDKFLSNSNNDQSFAIHKESGKIYSLSEVPNIELIVGDFVRQNNKFYKVSVVDGNLRVSKLSSNDNIKEYYATEDKYGNIYVLNDTLNNEKHGNLYYYTQKEYGGGVYYGCGDDGVMYIIDYTESIYFPVSSFDGSMNVTPVTAPLTREIKITISTGYDSANISLKTDLLIFKAGKCFHIKLNNWSDDVQAFKWYEDKWSSIGYGKGYFWLGGLGFAFSYNMRVYYIGGELLILAEHELFHFNMEIYTGEDNMYRGEKILNCKAIETDGDNLIVTTEGINGTTKSLVYAQDGQVKTKPLSEIYYDAVIITIQPLE